MSAMGSASGVECRHALCVKMGNAAAGACAGSGGSSGGCAGLYLQDDAKFQKGCRMRKFSRVSGPLPLALLAVVAAVGPAASQQRNVPPSREAAQYSFNAIVKKAAPAVVNVYVRGRAQVTSPLEEEFRRFFGERFGMPQERILSSLGSGVIVSPDGIVVTDRKSTRLNSSHLGI